MKSKDFVVYEAKKNARSRFIGQGRGNQKVYLGSSLVGQVRQVKDYLCLIRQFEELDSFFSFLHEEVELHGSFPQKRRPHILSITPKALGVGGGF